MALFGTEIIDLPSASALSGTEIVPVVQNGITSKTTINSIAVSAVSTPQFLTLAADGGLANERVFGVSGSGLTAVDGGAGNSYTVSLAGTVKSIQDNGTTGILVKPTSSTVATRSLQQPSAGFTISNADGVSGDPTFSLANSLASLQNLSGTGGIYRLGTDALTLRSITGTSNQITVTDGDGVSGAPTISISNNAILPGTGGVNLPTGTTAQRAGATGTIRWNTSLSQFEGFNGSSWNSLAGSGTVSTISVVSANGFAGTVSNPTTTPAITISTSVTGLIKGNGAAISAATAGTDYSLGTSALATGILKSTTSTGALSIAVAGDFPLLNQNTTGNSGSTDALKSATTTINVSSATAPTAGQVLTATSGTAANWQTPSAGSSAFSSLTGGTNTSAAMVVGSGASLAASGTGTITPSTINALITAGTNVSISGSGTTVSPYQISATGSLATSFADISSATNTTATMVLGSGSSLDTSGTGTNTATALKSASTNVIVSAATAPTAGQVLTATSGTAANWQTPSGGASNPSVLLLSTTPFSHTGSTSETAANTYTLAANSLSSSGVIRITLLYNKTGTNDIYTVRVRFGGISGTVYYLATSAATVGQVATGIVYIFANNSTSSQKGMGVTSVFSGLGNANASMQTSSVDTTSNVDILVTLQLANSSDTINLQGVIIEKLAP